MHFLEPHKLPLLSLHAATAEACGARACALQQEKPPQREVQALQLAIAPTLYN